MRCLSLLMGLAVLACGRPPETASSEAAAPLGEQPTSAQVPAGASGTSAPEAVLYPYPFRDPSLSPKQRAEDLVARLTVDEKIAQLLHDAPAIERLGVPAYAWWNEALHGVARSGRATVFPQAIGLAATFDDSLVKQVARAIANEARAKYNAAIRLGHRGLYAGLTFWSPNINIFRDPRWGRGQETYGEDPYLTSRMGVAFVKGLQGEHPKLLQTAACAKHFAVHSGPEGSRHEFDAKPSKKDLYETYLPAFEALIKEADVECVMSAYNRLYGEPASGSPWLLQELLRKQWGFDGHVVSDCWALEDFHKHHKVTRSSAESAALALRAGVNLNCGSTYPSLGQSLAEQRVTQAEIDVALVTLMQTRFRLGLFDPNTPYDTMGPELVGSDEHAALARRAAVRSIVLLKNDKAVLPLSKRIKQLAVLGPYGVDGYVLLGNYFGHSARLTTLVEGLTAKVDAGTGLQFRHAFMPDRMNDNPIDWTTGAARSADAVIVTLGLSGLIEGEEGAANASPLLGDRKDLRLPENQLDYLRRLRKAGDAPIVAVVFGGSPLDLAEVERLADAVLFAWYPGQEGGHALADVIFGDVAPSGRLPITFPKSVDDLPAFSDYAMAGRGYRYARVEPLYPFGFGLSYGRVEYLKLELSAVEVARGGGLSATLTLHNPSPQALSEVVQFYISDLAASVAVPSAQLFAFRRVELAPGQTQRVQVEVPAAAMQLVDDAGKRRIEAGRFRVTAAGAAPSPRAEALGSPRPALAEFEVR